MSMRSPGASMASYFVLLVALLLNGASCRLAKTSIREQQRQQQSEFQHRKLVKLFGEDGTTDSADRIDGKYIVVLNEEENLDAFLDSLKRTTRNEPATIQIQHEYRHAMVGFSAEIFSQHALHALLEDERVKEVAEVRYLD
jgi:hypothetical protein